jgi:ATP-binding cassette subfamily B protein
MPDLLNKRLAQLKAKKQGTTPQSTPPADDENVNAKDTSLPSVAGGAGPGLLLGGRGGGKAKDMKKTLKRLVAYMKSYMPMIVISLVLVSVGTVFNLIGPNLIREITDLIVEGAKSSIDLKAVTGIGMVLAFLYGFGFLFNYGQSLIMATVTQKVSKRMRTEIADKFNRLPLSYFDRETVGNVMSRVTNDVDTVSTTLNQSLSSLIAAVIMLVGSLVMMFVTNWILAICAVAASIIGFLFMTVLMGKSQWHFINQQRELGKINGHIEETYTGHSVIKAYNGEKEAVTAFEQTNGKLQKHALMAQFMSGLMMPIMNFIGNFGYVVVCVVGGVLAANGSISFGVIVAFMLYVRLFTQPLSQLAQAATNIQSTAAASEHIFELLDEKELTDESDKNTVLQNIKGDVDFQNVRFGYLPDKEIIHDFSATVKAGQKIAIVGPTGAGKTTMVNLLMRFYETNAGDILIDGTPISKLSRENVHNLFCMVLQDTWLFNGTIRENIIYNKKGVTDEQLMEACKAASVDHIIRSLPNGFDTVLDDNVSLSVGERQLITIARAMIENAPMLILDEATSSVDTRTELMIQGAMDKLMSGRTSFVIAHRLSTIKNADLILVMKDGGIIEQGTHEQLLLQSGFYAELWNSQFDILSSVQSCHQYRKSQARKY